MTQDIIIQQVDSNTFESQKYIAQDEQILSSFNLDTSFSQNLDIVEISIYDENRNKIHNYTAPDNGYYSVINGDIILKPEQNLVSLGFEQGTYYIKYDFFRKRLSSDKNNSYFISEISSERDEIRLTSNNILSTNIISSTNDFINYRENSTYFVDFYLNFGDNNLVLANNIKLDQTQDSPTILIKLYEPLPLSYSIKDIVWVEESISDPQTYSVSFPDTPIIIDDHRFIKGPNFSLNIKDQAGSSEQMFSFDNLLNSNSTSSQQQLKNILQNKGIDLNIDYEDYSNFIHFSSIKTRLENFYYKVSLIESSKNSIYNVDTNIDKIINEFDGYEHFLYFNSGSRYSWPKTNSSPPYQLAPTGSVDVWFEEMYTSASSYDENNQNYLYWTIPEYLRSDPENRNYELFLDMIGQHFDNIYIYIDNITNKFNADNRLKYGISKTLVADSIKDFGIKLYSNNFNINDLYTTFLGSTSLGNSFPLYNITDSLPTPTGYKYIDNKISSSNNNLIPLNDLNTQIYKRIYHNLPYLLKTKGTITGLRALITTFGIPDSILRINEFGGKDRNNSGDWDYSQNISNYSFNTQGGNYFSSSFSANTSFGGGSPDSIQFRFKASNIPTNNISQSLFTSITGESISSAILIEYSGSNNSESLYSGSNYSPYNTYAVVKFIPSIITPNISSSVYVPIFNGDWWSLQANISDNIASLYLANKLNGEIGFNASSSITGFSTLSWDNSTSAQIPYSSSISIDGKTYSPFNGLLQEVRYYKNKLNSDSFYNYVLNPFSSLGNSINSSPDELFFRAPLGSTSDISNKISIHPKVTGIWTTTASFSTGDSNFYLSSNSFIPNTENIFYDQPAVGMKNTITDKININNMVLPEGNTLSPFRSIQQKSFISSSYTPDINYLEIAFSPQDQINEDIMSQIGYLNIGDYIGDPRKVNENTNSYPDLDKLRNDYFLKYKQNYNIKDFVELIRYFDNSLFKMIKDFVPAKTSVSTGIIIKQHLLERNKQQPVQASLSNELYTSSTKNLPHNYEDNARLYAVEGGNAGSYEHVKLWNITQSWAQNTVFPYQPTSSNSKTILRDDQREFYNGELPGSSVYSELTEHCQKYKTGNTSSFDHDFDCQPSFNNIDKARPNPGLQDVDYSIGISSPINIEQINLGTATRATVPESNYTLKRHTLPRYEGSRATSDDVNLSTGLTGSYDNYPPVELKKTHFAYIDKIYDPYPIVNDITNFNIKYVIDSETNIDNPGLNDITYYNLIDTFSNRENIKVSLTIPKQEPQFINLNNEQSIRYVGKVAVPILYSQISSDKYTTSIPLTSSNSNMAGIVDYGVSASETKMNNIFGKNNLNNFNLSPVKITSSMIIRDTFGRVTSTTSPIQSSGIIKASNLDEDYKITWKVKIPSTVPQTIIVTAPTITLIDVIFNSTTNQLQITYGITSWGNGTPISNGVCWGPYQNITLETADAVNQLYDNNNSTGVREFVRYWTPDPTLTTPYTYYFRAYAKNNIDMVYSNEISIVFE